MIFFISFSKILKFLFKFLFKFYLFGNFFPSFFSVLIIDHVRTVLMCFAAVFNAITGLL